MQVVTCEGWADFRNHLSDFASLSRSSRNRFLFRGQADASWPLLATLDRRRGVFPSDATRDQTRLALLRDFQVEAIGLGAALPPMTDELAWELLARHHGLPTTILDWTRSPYVAAYFAFLDIQKEFASNVAIWSLDRDRFIQEELADVEIVDADKAISVNPRAIEQRGAFLRIRSASQGLSDLLAGALVRFDIPYADRNIALTELDAMMVTSRTLFRDLDSAARTAWLRFDGTETRA